MYFPSVVKYCSNLSENKLQEQYNLLALWILKKMWSAYIMKSVIQNVQSWISIQYVGVLGSIGISEFDVLVSNAVSSWAAKRCCFVVYYNSLPERKVLTNFNHC